MSDDIDVNELIEQHKEETSDGRSKTEPSKTTSEDDDTPSLEEAIRKAYHGLDEGNVRENLTIRDGNLAALFVGLDNADQLADVGYDAAVKLDREPENTATRAGVLRLLVRIGLNEIDESLIEAGKEGLARYEEDQRADF